MNEASPTMSVPELAQRLGIDQSTAWRYLRAGKLPGVQVGSRWLIDRERVERFLAGKEDAAGQPLVLAPPEGHDVPALTLLPERTPDTAETALSWLRGLHAALELLVSAAAAPSGEGSFATAKCDDSRNFRS
jgi:excisionase family DNA binding protein